MLHYGMPAQQCQHVPYKKGGAYARFASHQGPPATDLGVG
jgi:hypothetical protein